MTGAPSILFPFCTPNLSGNQGGLPLTIFNLPLSYGPYPVGCIAQRIETRRRESRIGDYVPRYHPLPAILETPACARTAPQRIDPRPRSHIWARQKPRAALRALCRPCQGLACGWWNVDGVRSIRALLVVDFSFFAVRPTKKHEPIQHRSRANSGLDPMVQSKRPRESEASISIAPLGG